MSQPESLNLWDRLFNRYRKEIADRGSVNGKRFRYWRDGGGIIPGSEEYYTRHWIEYRIIDRLTGSETIKREDLD